MWYVSVSFSQSVQRATCDYQFWTPSDGRQAVQFAAHSSSSRRVHNRRAWTQSACSAAYAVSNQLPVSRRAVDNLLPPSAIIN